MEIWERERRSEVDIRIKNKVGVKLEQQVAFMVHLLTDVTMKKL